MNDNGDLWILSYDVDGADRATAVRVCQLIFGRRNTTTREGQAVSYDQKGFLHRPGVAWIGQSVLILPDADAQELRGRLEGMGVSVGVGRITIEPQQLARFRRRRRGRRS